MFIMSNITLLFNDTFCCESDWRRNINPFSLVCQNETILVSILLRYQRKLQFLWHPACAQFWELESNANVRSMFLFESTFNTCCKGRLLFQLSFGRRLPYSSTQLDLLRVRKVATFLSYPRRLVRPTGNLAVMACLATCD